MATNMATNMATYMATYMVHWLKQADYDRLLDTGCLPQSGLFSEELPRSVHDDLPVRDVVINMMEGLVRHEWYARVLHAFRGVTVGPRFLPKILSVSVAEDTASVFVVWEDEFDTLRAVTNSEKL